MHCVQQLICAFTDTSGFHGLQSQVSNMLGQTVLWWNADRTRKCLHSCIENYSFKLAFIRLRIFLPKEVLNPKP